MSTHCVPHVVSAQPHIELVQPVPCGHTLPQLPQFPLSLVRSVQNAAPLFPHAVGVELGHAAHELIVQSCVALHSVPHPPQFERSEVMSVHGLLGHTMLGGMRQDPPSSV
jgi:hypothetical protein